MADTKIKTNNIESLAVTHDKLHTDMDLTGKTVQVATPTAASHPATKNYVDTEIASVTDFAYNGTTEVLTIDTADGSSFTADISGLASETYVNTAVSNLVDSAPGTLDTLNELAAALGDDANFATTVSTNLGNKVDKINITGATVGSGTAIPVITYNAQGQITSATTTAVAGIDAVTFSGGELTISTGDGSDYVTDFDARYFTETEANANFLGINAKAADADTLDGIESGSFLRSDADDDLTGNIRFYANSIEHGKLNADGSLYLGTSSPIADWDIRDNSGNSFFALDRADGNVGIGTNSPNDAKLQVFGNSSSDWGGYFYNQNAGGIGLHVETNSYGTEQLLRLSSLTGSGGSNTVRMVVRADGNVGIGTSSPENKLTVNNPRRNDSGTNSLGAAVIAGPISVPAHDFASSTAIFRVHGTDATNNIQFGVGNGTYNYHGWIQASFDNAGSGSGSKHLLLQPIGGNVGIGTASPGNALTVVASSSQATTDGAVVIKNGMNNGFETLKLETNNDRDSVLSFRSIGTNSYWWGMGIDNSDGGKFKMGADNLLGVNNRLVITQAGNVGIGTESPDQRLHVKGRMKIGELAAGDDGDYGLIISRKGTGASPGTYSFSSAAIEYEGLYGQGPASYIQKGDFLNASYGRLVTTDSGTQNGAIIDISYDSGLSPLRLDHRGNLWIGHNRASQHIDASSTHTLKVYGGAHFGANNITKTGVGNGYVYANRYITTNAPSGDGDDYALSYAQSDYSVWDSIFDDNWISNNSGWGTFWAGNSGAAYRRVSGDGNPNEYVMVGSGQKRFTFDLDAGGHAYFDGSLSQNNYDYAEYFEWDDGNSQEEDRRGYSVVLTDAGTIRKAIDSDDPSDIIGAISGTAAIIGDAAMYDWAGKYEIDEWGTPVYDQVNQISWKTEDGVRHSYDEDRIPAGIIVPEDASRRLHKRARINPNYDPSVEYVPRDRRSEWGIVGLLGKVRVRDESPKNPNWKYIKTIAGKELWLIR